MSHALRTAARSLAMLMLVLMTGSALAQTGDRFYAGKTLTILVGSTPGGYYDIGARIVAARSIAVPSATSGRAWQAPP